MFVVVSYDIVDNKKRNRMSNLLLDYGRRVQKSVFECDLNEKNLSQMIEEAASCIDADEDSLKIYRLCESCLSRIRTYGRQTNSEESMII